MLKFDPKKPLRKGDVILVEAVVKYGFDPNEERSTSGVNDPSLSVSVGYNDAYVGVSKVVGIARRRFDVGETVIFGADQSGKVLSVHGEWLWIDLGSGDPTSVHQSSVTLPDRDQPDLLAGA